jgi:hypothetical protein
LTSMPSVALSENPLPIGADAIGHRNRSTTSQATLNPLPSLDMPIKPPKIIFVVLVVLGICLIIAAVGVSLAVALGNSSTHMILILVGATGSVASSGVAFLLWRDRQSIRRLQQEAVRLEPNRWQVQLREKEQQISKCRQVKLPKEDPSTEETAQSVEAVEQSPGERPSTSENANSQAVQVSKSMPKMKDGIKGNEDPITPSTHNRLQQLHQTQKAETLAPKPIGEQRIEIQPEPVAVRGGGSKQLKMSHLPAPSARGSTRSMILSDNARDSQDQQRKSDVHEKAINKVDQWMEDDSKPAEGPAFYSPVEQNENSSGPTRLPAAGWMGALRQSLTRESQAVGPPSPRNSVHSDSGDRALEEGTHGSTIEQAGARAMQSRVKKLPFLGKYGLRWHGA